MAKSLPATCVRSLAARPDTDSGHARQDALRTVGDHQFLDLNGDLGLMSAQLRELFR